MIFELLRMRRCVPAMSLRHVKMRVSILRHCRLESESVPNRHYRETLEAMPYQSSPTTNLRSKDSQALNRVRK